MYTPPSRRRCRRRWQLDNTLVLVRKARANHSSQQITYIISLKLYGTMRTMARGLVRNSRVGKRAVGLKPGVTDIVNWRRPRRVEETPASELHITYNI